MGVRSCFKEGCENIMCNIYSINFGYICNECYEELRGYLSRKGYSKKRIAKFMKKEKKNELTQDQEDIDYFLSEEFNQ